MRDIRGTPFIIIQSKQNAPKIRGRCDVLDPLINRKGRFRTAGTPIMPAINDGKSKAGREQRISRRQQPKVVMMGLGLGEKLPITKGGRVVWFQIHIDEKAMPLKAGE